MCILFYKNSILFVFLINSCSDHFWVSLSSWVLIKVALQSSVPDIHSSLIFLTIFWFANSVPLWQGCIQGVFEAGILVWVPKFGTQKNFSVHFIFNGVLCVYLFFNQIWSKGLKKMCDCTLKLRLVYIN